MLALLYENMSSILLVTHFNDVTLNSAGEMLFGKKVPPSNVMHTLAAMYPVCFSCKVNHKLCTSSYNKLRKNSANYLNLTISEEACLSAIL